MKGRRKDLDFFNQFIVKCAENNQLTPVEIINSAQSEIEKIDEKIKEVEELKKIRGKLLDVIYILGKPSTPEIKTDCLVFSNISNLSIAQYICRLIALENKVKVSSLKQFSEQDLFICIKQLVSNKIIYKKQDLLMESANFSKFVKFLQNEIQ